MQDKNGTSKETDITGVLVVGLFVMVGILFVTMSNKFTKTKTSTFTKAAPRRGAANDFCKQKFIDKFEKKDASGLTVYGGKYANLSSNVTATADGSTDCGSLNYTFAFGLITSDTNSSRLGACCVPLSVMWHANDLSCSDQTKGGQLTAMCKDNEKCTGDYGNNGSGDYETPLGNKSLCDNILAGRFSFAALKNYCCINADFVNK